MDLAARALVLIGAGFLVANARLAFQYLRFRRLSAHALLIWKGPKPRNYKFTIALGAASGLLVINNLYLQGRYPAGPSAAVLGSLFGEMMMFLYFACLTPLSWQIARGFYAQGIWADTSFIPYHEVGGISWREGEHTVALIVISRLRSLARRLAVPVEHYGEARRLLRDKIGEHEIHFGGTGLDLGAHDERDEA